SRGASALGAAGRALQQLLQEEPSGGKIGCFEKDAQVLVQLLTHALRRRFEHLAGEVRLAALPGAALEGALHGGGEPAVRIRDHQIDSCDATTFQPPKETAPAPF